MGSTPTRGIKSNLFQLKASFKFKEKEINDEELELFKRGNFFQLIEILTKRLQGDPQNNSVKLDLAITFAHYGNYDKAIDLYEEILEKDRDNPEILINAGIVHHWKEDSQRALEIYQRALRLSKKRKLSPEILSLGYNNLGVIWESLGYFEKAVVAYKKALSIYPENFMAAKYLAQLKERGDSDYSLVRARILPDGTKRLEIWYYHEIDIEKINVDEFLGI